MEKTVSEYSELKLTVANLLQEKQTEVSEEKKTELQDLTKKIDGGTGKNFRVRKKG